MTIRFSFQKRLGRMSLDVAVESRVSRLGIFGPSGCGKTSVLYTLAGFYRPDAGEIAFGDEIYFSSDRKIDVSPSKRSLGMVFQEGLLFPHMTVKENLEFACSRRAPLSSEDRGFWDRVVDVLSLSGLMNRKPVFLSGGEKQRAALARTLLHRPHWILLDEPLSQLDWRTRRLTQILVKSVSEEFHIPMIMVTHSLAEMLFLAEEIVVMRQGKTVGHKSADRIFEKDEIFSLARQEESWDNVYELALVDREENGMAVCDFGGHPLKLMYDSSWPPVPRLKIVLRAEDVLLAAEKPHGLSARNSVPLVIENLFSDGWFCHVKGRVGSEVLWVEISDEAARELKLVPGKTVFAMIKARSLVVLNQPA